MTNKAYDFLIETLKKEKVLQGDVPEEIPDGMINNQPYRFLVEMLEGFAKQEAIEFLKWLECNYDTAKTIERLYNLYKYKKP